MTTRRLRHGIILALVGLLAGLAVVLGLDWAGTLPGSEDRASNDKLPFAAPSDNPTDPARGPGDTTPPAAKDAPTAEPNRQAGGEGDRNKTAPVPDTAGPSAPANGKTAEAAEAPTFDIVRVEPNGEAVVAGRGKPNTVVEMLVDGKAVARALADPNGQFAIVPPALPKGSSEIVLRSKAADGQETRSRQSVAVSVPPDGTSRPLVALTAPGAATVVMSQPGAPETPSATAGAKDAPATARIVSVDSEPGGRLFVTGAGKPGSTVRLYLNDTLIAPARIGPDGRVTFTIGRGVAGGRYQVRLDEIDPQTGKVTHRAEVPFAMPQQVAEAGRSTTSPGRPGTPEATAKAVPGKTEKTVPPGTAAGPDHSRPNASGGPGQTGISPDAGATATIPPTVEPMASTPLRAGTEPPEGVSQPGSVFVPAIATAKITRGDSLWQISKRTYGRGERYTVIYDANQNQIRDPDLIYPGQIFVLPNDQRG